jgi:hypothetical protein
MDSKVDMAIYNVLVNYMDSLTIKSMQHHYPHGTRLLRDLINMCNGDSKEVGDGLKHEFNSMHIGKTDSASNFIIHVKAKAKENDAQYHHKMIKNGDIFKCILHGISKSHSIYGSLIMNLEEYDKKKSLSIIKKFTKFNHEGHASHQYQEFASHTHQKTSGTGQGGGKGSSNASTKDSQKLKGYCDHCSFCGHQTIACHQKKMYLPKATDEECKKHQLFCKHCKKPGLHDTSVHESS